MIYILILIRLYQYGNIIWYIITCRNRCFTIQDIPKKSKGMNICWGRHVLENLVHPDHGVEVSGDEGLEDAIDEVEQAHDEV